MADEKYKPDWRVIGKSVKGASHKRSGLPNQDAIGWLPKSAAGSPRLALAISDGHGGARYFRSDVGSRCAVEAALAEMQQLLTGQFGVGQLGPSAIKHLVEEKLPKGLVDAWKSSVSKHYAQNDFKKEEQIRLVEWENLAAWEAVKADPKLAYGATLLTVLVTEAFIIYLQLGDGDILTVSEAGKVSKPLASDARLIANETTSLCSRDAWRDFRVHFQRISHPSELPALILLSTDGYANSFRDEKDFLKVGSDILEMIRSDTLQEVEANIEGWLNEASRSGSGDDITLGICCRMDALLNPTNLETLTVSKQGRYSTINDAIKHARPNTRILVEPGLYNEGLVLDKPLEIVAAGPVEQVIVESADWSCIQMQTDYARVGGLTLRGRNAVYFAVDIPRGQLVLTNCDITSNSLACIAIHNPTANPVIQGCKVHDGKGHGIVVTKNGRGRVEDCDIFGNTHPGIAIRQGGDPFIQRCMIHDGKSIGILVTDSSQGMIDRCDIFANTGGGVVIQGGDPVVRGCEIHDGKGYGILVRSDGKGDVKDCNIFHNAGAGVAIRQGGNPVISGCSLYEGQEQGIFVWESGEGRIEECNIYENAHIGVEIKEGGNPVIQQCGIYDGKRGGILVHESGQGKVENCKIYGNADVGVEIKKQGDPVIQRCGIYDGKRGGILVHEGGQGKVEDCDIYGNADVGVEIKSLGDPLITGCRINRNAHRPILRHQNGKGIIEKCDVADDTRTAWDRISSTVLRRRSS